MRRWRLIQVALGGSMKNEWPNASAEFKRLNPHLFGLGAVVAAQHKPQPRRALDQDAQRQPRSKGSLGFCVTLISCRRRLVDEHDNLRHGLKPICDCVAYALGLDDADPRVRWQYGQVVTRGEQGVMVRIEQL